MAELTITAKDSHFSFNLYPGISRSLLVAFGVAKLTTRAIKNLKHIAYIVPTDIDASSDFFEYCSRFVAQAGDICLDPKTLDLLVYTKSQEQQSTAVFLARMSEEDLASFGEALEHTNAVLEISLEDEDVKLVEAKQKQLAYFDFELPALQVDELLEVIAYFNASNMQDQMLAELSVEEQKTKLLANVDALLEHSANSCNMCDIRTELMELEAEIQKVSDLQSLKSVSQKLHLFCKIAGLLAADIVYELLVDEDADVPVDTSQLPGAPHKLKQAKHEDKNTKKSSQKVCKHGYSMDECVCKLGKKAAKVHKSKDAKHDKHHKS